MEFPTPTPIRIGDTDLTFEEWEIVRDLVRKQKFGFGRLSRKRFEWLPGDASKLCTISQAEFDLRLLEHAQRKRAP